MKHNWQTRQIEGFVEHSSERATQEVAGKPYLVTRSILYILQPPPTEDNFLESRLAWELKSRVHTVPGKHPHSWVSASASDQYYSSDLCTGIYITNCRNSIGGWHCNLRICLSTPLVIINPPTLQRSYQRSITYTIEREGGYPNITAAHRHEGYRLSSIVLGNWIHSLIPSHTFLG